MKIVLCRGVFDLFHVAHLRHLEEARSMGDYLVVSLTSDAKVREEKRNPITPEDERREILLGLRCVSAVDICGNYMESLEKWKPGIYCKGFDHMRKGFLPGETEYCLKHGIEIRNTRENPQTTTHIIERIRCAS